MTGFLEHPITDKYSKDEKYKNIICAASTMQGWPDYQEDALCLLPNFDEEISLFAVYDGHGGRQVAMYCCQQFPKLLKKQEAFQTAHFDTALRDAFLQFDASLKSDDVIQELNALAENQKCEKDSGIEMSPPEIASWLAGVSIEGKSLSIRPVLTSISSSAEEFSENLNSEVGSSIPHDRSPSDDQEIECTSKSRRIVVKRKPGDTSGCTAVVALLKGNELYVGNAGDSRCIICRSGQAMELSRDHKPGDTLERARIVHAGGVISPDGRINYGLNISRAIGDHTYKRRTDLQPEKQMVIAVPDIHKLTLCEEDEFMVIASDGIWDCMKNREVVDFIKLRLQEGKERLSQICEEMFDHCLGDKNESGLPGYDNMAAIIVQFCSVPHILKSEEKVKPSLT